MLDIKWIKNNKDTKFTSDKQYDDYLKNVHFKNDPEKYTEYKKYQEDGSLPNNQDFKNISLLYLNIIPKRRRVIFFNNAV